VDGNRGDSLVSQRANIASLDVSYLEENWSAPGIALTTDEVAAIAADARAAAP
jgi:hypothetical protein